MNKQRYLDHFLIKKWNIKDNDIIDLIRHTADHAGAQGHLRNFNLELGEGCPECYKLMKRLFPEHW